MEEKIDGKEIRGEGGIDRPASEWGREKWKKEKEIDVQPLHTLLLPNY